MKVDLPANSRYFSLLVPEKNKQEKKSFLNPQKASSPLFDFSEIQKNSAQLKKKAALARMAQLKTQLEAMLKLAHTGAISPRLIAQMARELKSLVAQYGSANGGGSELRIPQFSVSGEGSAESAETVETVEASAEMAALAEEAEIAATETANVSETEIQAALAAAKEFENNPATKADETSDSDSVKQKTVQGVQDKSADMAADSAFFKEAKRLAKIIKLLMDASKKAESEQEIKEEKNAKRDIKEMDETIAKVETETMAAYSSNLSVGGYGEAGDAVQPEINVGNVSIYV